MNWTIAICVGLALIVAGLAWWKLPSVEKAKVAADAGTAAAATTADLLAMLHTAHYTIAALTAKLEKPAEPVPAAPAAPPPMTSEQVAALQATIAHLQSQLPPDASAPVPAAPAAT